MVVYCLGVYTFGFVPAVVRCLRRRGELLFSLTILSESQKLVSRFACNTRVIVDASSDPPVSNVKSL